MSPVIRARAVVVGFVVAVLTLAGPASPALAEPSSLVISDLRTSTGTVQFVLSAHDLPIGVNLFAGGVTVRSGGIALPTEVRATTKAYRPPPRSLLVLLDATTRISPDQWDTMKAAVVGLAGTLPPDVALGLLAITTKPAVVVAPTADRAALTEAVAALRQDGTASVQSGLDAASSTMDAIAGERRVLVLSDGRDVGLAVPAPGRARLATAAVPFDVVAVGASGNGVLRLLTIADATGGHLRESSSRSGAVEAVRSAGRSFGELLAVTATVPANLAGQAATLYVTVEGTDLTAVTPVTFSPAAATVHPAGRSGRGWLPGWAGYLFAALLFAAIGLAVLALAWPRSEAYRRIRQIAHFGPARKVPKPPGESSARTVARTVLAATASVVRTGGLEQRLAMRLARAGMGLRPHEWLLVRAGVALATGVALFGLAGWVGGLMGLALGWLVTVLYQTSRVDRRSSQFAEQLPDALQLVIGSLRSGFSLQHSLDSLVRESTDPIAAEFGRAMAEHKLGVDVSDALERVAQRTQSDDLGWTVMAVRIQREVGGNLAEVLQTTVDTMRERGRLRRHVRALSAEGRLSAWVLIALPIVLSLFMFVYRRDYMMPLFTDPSGLTMLIGGGLLFVTGIVWMTRVIKVEA